METRAYILDGSIYGKLMLLIGALIMVPVLILPFYPDEMKYAVSFAAPSLVSCGLGLCVCCIKKPKANAIQKWQTPLQRGSLPVLFAWCFGFLAGAAPFVISGQMSVLHALFESVNGWTTAGFTVADVTALPHIFLFHRSFIQYCGGLGFILVILSLVSSKQAVSLYEAEGHSERLMPSLKHTLRAIVSIYIGFSVLGALLYLLFGMKPFDAVCHTMSALSTAGFTTQPNSIGQYASYPIELITIILMLIGSTNFAVLFLLTKFKFSKIARVSELRFMFILILIFTPLITFSLVSEVGMGFWAGLHQSLFGVVAIFTTTGYHSTMNYAMWPPFAVGLIIVLMVIGGSIGSTAGGIKMLRAYLLVRIAGTNIQKKVSSKRRVTVMYYYGAQGKIPIDDSLILDTCGFVFCYMMLLIIGTLLMTLSEGCSLYDAMFEFTSAFATVGITNGITNASTSARTLIIEMVGMVLGRLEIFIVFIGIHSGFSKIKNQLSISKNTAGF